MREYQSLSHVRWECKYHIAFVPKYRKKVLYGRTRQRIGKIFHQLCRQKEVGLIEGHAMPDHVHNGAEYSAEAQRFFGAGLSEREISHHDPS